MYRTCLHCHGALGANEVVEAMPVGRRLAFDARRGRLWIVCPRCRRWNLTPLEERWEAIEQCERMSREARQRVSTDNVGLARVAGGVELVRIGEPRRPEMAAWRYGPVLQRRRRRHLATTGGGLAAIWATSAAGQAGVLGGAGAVGAALPFVGMLALGAFLGTVVVNRWRPRVLLPDGRVRRIRTREWSELSLRPSGGAWSLQWRPPDGIVTLDGVAAERALRSVIASANTAGARREELVAANGLLESPGGVEHFIRRTARAAEREGLHSIAVLPPDLRLAIEIALHEESERRAMEGELAALEAEWRLAEEIARIADDLLLPDAVRSRLAAVASEEGA